MLSYEEMEYLYHSLSDEKEIEEGIRAKLADAMCDFEAADHVIKNAPYELTVNQMTFVKDAVTQGVEVDFSYSGRGMYGKVCPAVRLDEFEAFGTKVEYSEDSMGKGRVLYAPQ